MSIEVAAEGRVGDGSEADGEHVMLTRPQPMSPIRTPE